MARRELDARVVRGAGARGFFPFPAVGIDDVKEAVPAILELIDLAPASVARGELDGGPVDRPAIGVGEALVATRIDHAEVAAAEVVHLEELGARRAAREDDET